jgi:hypothetical protein
MITTKQSLVCALALFLTVGTAFAQQNTAFGTGALQSNTSGYENSAFGFDALFSNTSGFENTAVGDLVLTSNTTGYDNTASGYFALLDNTTGFNNTASGYAALINNTTGNYNTATGVSALQSSTTGQSDTARPLVLVPFRTAPPAAQMLAMAPWLSSVTPVAIGTPPQEIVRYIGTRPANPTSRSASRLDTTLPPAVTMLRSLHREPPATTIPSASALRARKGRPSRVRSAPG